MFPSTLIDSIQIRIEEKTAGFKGKTYKLFDWICSFVKFLISKTCQPNSDLPSITYDFGKKKFSLLIASIE